MPPFIGGYFFALMNSANIHPINDQPNISDPTRTRILSYLEQSFADAKYAGAKTIHTRTIIATIYFNTNKIFGMLIIYIPYFAFVPNSSAMRIN